jgi:hypothetical protein
LSARAPPASVATIDRGKIVVACACAGDGQKRSEPDSGPSRSMRALSAQVVPGARSTSVALVSSTSSGTTAQGARDRSSVVPSPTGSRKPMGSLPPMTSTGTSSEAGTPSTVAVKRSWCSPTSEASGVQRNIASPLA